jgi:hypothetical protein
MNQVSARWLRIGHNLLCKTRMHPPSLPGTYRAIDT